MTRVLVTGATGFVGSVLCETLANQGFSVRAAVRNPGLVGSHLDDVVNVGEIDETTDWSAAVRGVDVIVHAAARAHILRDAPENAALYHRTNCEGTRSLLQAARSAGVARLIYLSTIKVNGEGTRSQPFEADAPPAPQDDYARSKLAAEQLVVAAGAARELESCVVRPPLVYGPKVRANFLRLMRWVDREVPLPLGSVRNSRSLVSVWNLCDLCVRLARMGNWAPVPPRLLVADGEDLSTAELVRRLSVAMGRRSRLIPMPVAFLRLGATLLGRGMEIERLCGSLQVDIGPTRRALEWNPPLSVDEGLARTVRWYLESPP